MTALRQQSVETVAAAKDLLGLNGYCAESGKNSQLCRPMFGQTSAATIIEEGAVVVENIALATGVALVAWGMGEILAAVGAWLATASTVEAGIGAGTGMIAITAVACGDATEPSEEVIPDGDIDLDFPLPDGDREHPEFAPHTDGDDDSVEGDVEMDPALCGNGAIDPGEECESNEWGEWIGCTDCLLDPQLTLLISRVGIPDAIRREEERAIFRIDDEESPAILCSLPERDASGTFSRLHRFDSRTSLTTSVLTGFYGSPWRQAAVDTETNWLFYQMQEWQETRPRLVHVDDGIVIPLEGKDDVTLEGMERVCASRDLTHLGGIALVDGSPTDPARTFRRTSLSDLMERNDPPNPAAQGVQVYETLHGELAAGARATTHCMDDRGNAAIAGWDSDRNAIGAILLVAPDNSVTRVAPDIIANASASAPVIAPEGTLCFLAMASDATELICTSANDPDAIERSPAPEAAREIIGISDDGRQVIAFDGARALSLFDRELGRWIEPDLGGITQGDIIVAAAVAGRWLFVRSEYNDGGDIATAVWRISLDETLTAVPASR